MGSWAQFRTQCRCGFQIDLNELAFGEQVTIKHNNLPVFVKKLTEQQIKDEAVVSVAQFPDKHARNSNIRFESEASIDNRSVGIGTGKNRIVVFTGICTRLGCMPIGNTGDFNGGWFCPCGGAHYDAVGRIRKGPAPQNLMIPPFEVSDQSILSLLPPRKGPTKKEIEGLLFGRDV